MLDHTVQTLDGQSKSLADFRGKTLLIVNTASECGYTPQYAGLQQLQERYAARGFTVLGFPSNDFGGQEPGSPETIAAFCNSRFHVSFPLFAKVHAKGDDIAPIYKALTELSPPDMRGPIKWNFTKFLLNPAGQVVARFEPGVEPLDPGLVAAVEAELPARA